MRVLVNTWADGFGRWHAAAATRRSAHRAIRREVAAREATGARPVVRIEVVRTYPMGDTLITVYREVDRG